MNKKGGHLLQWLSVGILSFVILAGINLAQGRNFPGFMPVADGDLTAEVLYVNYGLPADYAVLDSMGISVKGKIAIARYGKSWRGIQSRLAAERGAVACLLYSAPAEDG